VEDEEEEEEDEVEGRKRERKEEDKCPDNSLISMLDGPFYQI